MTLKNATCKFAFLAGERLMDLDTIVTAGLFEDGQFDYCSGATVEIVEDITEAGSFHVHCTSENFSHLGDAVLKIARILKATGYELIDLSAHCTDDTVGGTEEEYWCLANGHIVASTRQGAIGSILRDDDGGWRDTTGTVFGADNREFAALGVLSDIFGDQYRAEELLESIFVIAGAGDGHPEVITREELNDALSNILRAGFDAADTVDDIETIIANACRGN